MDVIEMVAIQSLINQYGEKWEDVVSAHRGYPKLSSAVTATFDVRVELKGNVFTPYLSLLKLNIPNPLF